MASGKKRVTQTELRRLMNEHKGKTPKKIVSPVAKYSNTGVLSCTLCNMTVVSELVWEAHTKCRKHLDNLQRLRDVVRPAPTPAPAPAPAPTPAPHVWKRPAPANPLPAPTPEKKIKGILKNAPKVMLTIEKSSCSSSVTLSTGETLSLATSEGRYQHLETKSKRKGNGLVETVVECESLVQVESTMSTSSTLPENFFDSSASVSSRTETLTSTDRPAAGDDVGNPDDVLPEGFFDDPQLDAKARNIEYKNPVEEEWEKFQKEIKEQSSVSAQIISEDQDEATVDRQMDEIDEQMRNWSRVLGMELRKESLEQTKPRREGGSDQDSSNDEDDFQEFLDWRVKKAYD